MKEKIKEVLKTGWFGFIIALVITILLMNEEKGLGDMSGSWALALITSLFTGLLMEGFRLVMQRKSFGLILFCGLWVVESALRLCT